MLSINISELIWTIINFFLLLFLLKHFLFDPISRFMDDRQARIDAGTEAERQAKAELEETARALEARKTETRREDRELLDKAAAADAERSAAAYARARDEAAVLQEQGEQNLKARNDRDAEALKAREPELAALLAAHLLGQEE